MRRLPINIIIIVALVLQTVIVAMPVQAAAPTIDLGTAIVVMDLKTSNVSQTFATLSWNTNLPGNTWVFCSGPGISGERIQSRNEKDGVTNHTYTIDKLTADTVYTCRVSSAEDAGATTNYDNKAEASISFTTAKPVVADKFIFSNISYSFLTSQLTYNEVKVSWQTDKGARFSAIKWYQVGSNEDYWRLVGGSHLSAQTKHEGIIVFDNSPVMNEGLYFKYKVCNAIADNDEKMFCGEERSFFYNNTSNTGSKAAPTITLGTANFNSPPTTAKIYWTTDNVPASCRLVYGTNADTSNGASLLGQVIQSPTSSNYNRYHYAADLTSLQANAKYYYKVLCSYGLKISESSIGTIVDAANAMPVVLESSESSTVTIGEIIETSNVSNAGTTDYSDPSKIGPLPLNYNEWIVVYATNGPQIPASSVREYRGIVEIMMDGVIRSSSTNRLDAYYMLTDYDGNAITPAPAGELGLYVNGRLLADIWPQSYTKGSQYVFRADLGPIYRPVIFSVGDTYIADNAGSFKLAIKGDSRVPQQALQTNVVQDISETSDRSTTSSAIDPLIIKLERTISNLEQKVVELEKRLATTIDTALTNRLKGRILLQVEENGEAWYVDPQSENKLYLKDGQASYDIMRSLGLGISNANLERIPIGIQDDIYTLKDTDGDGIPDNLEVALGTNPNNKDSDGDGFDDKTEIQSGFRPDGTEKFVVDSALINRLSGRIVLQVESHGEAWYINPTDNRRYYLGDGDTAYNIMRFLSLGINNSDLRKIQVGEFSE